MHDVERSGDYRLRLDASDRTGKFPQFPDVYDMFQDMEPRQKVGYDR